MFQLSKNVKLPPNLVLAIGLMQRATMLLLDCYSVVCYSMVICSCSRPHQSFTYSLWRVKDCLVSTEFYLLLFWHASSDGIYGNTLPSALSWSIPCLQVDYPSVSETLFIAFITDPHATWARCQLLFPTAFLLSLSPCVITYIWI